MKKKLTALILMMIMVFTLAACGSTKNELAEYAGTYKLTEWADGDTSISGDDIATFGLDVMSLTLNEDGTGSMTYGEEDTEEDFDFTWEVGKMTLDGDTQEVAMDGSTVVIDVSYTSEDDDGNETTIPSSMTFTKQ